MNGVTFKQILYLVLAILGVVGTWYFNLQMPADELANFVGAMFGTPITSSLAIDLVVAVLTFFLWMIPEAGRLGMRWWVIALIVILTFLVAFAFSFPLFMFLRERALERKRA